MCFYFLDRCPQWCWCVGVAWNIAGGSGSRAAGAASEDYTGCGNGSYHKVRCSPAFLKAWAVLIELFLDKAGPVADSPGAGPFIPLLAQVPHGHYFKLLQAQNGLAFQ